jgi:hypothetical protein
VSRLEALRTVEEESREEACAAEASFVVLDVIADICYGTGLSSIANVTRKTFRKWAPREARIVHCQRGTSLSKS